MYAHRVLLLALFAPFTALAQTDEYAVPAVDPSAAPGAVSELPGGPPPVNVYSGEDSTLSPRERAAVDRAHAWMEGGTELVSTSIDGKVVFRYGTSYPTIVCAPLAVCDLELQPGERVRSLETGDKQRWSLTPSLSGGEGGEVTHVIIKPFDIGLTTNLVILTDRRTYRLKLVSRKDDFMPAIAFSYPEDDSAAWAAYQSVMSAPPPAAAMMVDGVDPGRLDFGFTMSGDSPSWKPLRIYTDGSKTFIQFPQNTSEAPALVVLGENSAEQLVNYRSAGDRYIVDQVIEQALLVSGVGKQAVKVKIHRSR